MKFGPDHGQTHQSLDLGQYLDGLYGYAMVLSRNSTESEDLVQETCLRALRAIGGLRAQGSVKSWLFTILRNIWLNQLRQRRTGPNLLELDAEASGDSTASRGVPRDHHPAGIRRAFVSGDRRPP